MAKIKREYLTFYLDGREERLIKSEVDAEAVAKEVVEKGGDLHEVIMKHATDAAAPFRSNRHKRRWCDEEADGIKAAGGDREAAYDAFLQGRIDELAYRIQPDVLEAVDALVTPVGGRSPWSPGLEGDEAEDSDDE